MKKPYRWLVLLMLWALISEAAPSNVGAGSGLYGKHGLHGLTGNAGSSPTCTREVSLKRTGWDGLPLDGSVEGRDRKIDQYAERVRTKFDSSPVFISILYLTIFFSILCLLVLLVLILLNRGKLIRKHRLEEYLKEEYQAKLMDYLFEEKERPLVMKELHEIASNRFNRQILINQMIDLSVNFKGEIKEIVRGLYLELGLKEDSLARAQSRKWHHNIKGFRELAFMHIAEAAPLILEKLNAGNDILRMEAHIALVSLSEMNPLNFLHSLERPLNVWEQITLHEFMIHHDIEEPDFSQWFHSDNTSIVIFALEMTAWFKQTDSVRGVIRLFEHFQEEVRRAAYKTCGQLLSTSSLPSMIRRYDHESQRNRQQILKVFAQIPLPWFLPFLRAVLAREENVQLQLAATKAIMSIGDPGISVLKELMIHDSVYKKHQLNVMHLLDKRIH